MNTINEKMTNLANTIRAKSGRTDSLTIDEMAMAVEGINVGVDTSKATATSNDILSGKIAYALGEEIIGTIEEKEAETYIPGTNDQIVPAGVYLKSPQIILGDSNLLPENIKKDISIFNTVGTYEGSGEIDIESVRKQVQDELWNGILETKKNFEKAFYDWQLEYIRPPKKIIPTTATSMCQTFRNCKKLKAIEKDYFDFSQKPSATANADSYYYTFEYCQSLQIIEDVGIGSINPVFQFSRTFYYCNNLHTIEKITVAETTKYSKTFDYCRKLVNITFDGTIGQNGLDFHWSPLSKASIENIINHLSSTTTGLSITMPKAAINTAFGINVDDVSTYPEGSEYYILRHSKDNWTINYS